MLYNYNQKLLILTVIISNPMKSRTKSTRENLTIESKHRKVSEEGSKGRKGNSKREDGDTRKYLLKTLNILQQHVKINKVDKKSNNAVLSASVYDIVRNNLNHFSQSMSKAQLCEYSTNVNNVSHKEFGNEVNKSTASLVNISAINEKRRSNSTLDNYFKQKFGSPAKDEQTIEKKLRVLKALKRSQQIVSRAGQNTSSVINSQSRIQNSVLQEITDKNIMIADKIRTKRAK